jgi:hypothetical protein
MPWDGHVLTCPDHGASGLSGLRCWGHAELHAEDRPDRIDPAHITMEILMIFVVDVWLARVYVAGLRCGFPCGHEAVQTSQRSLLLRPLTVTSQVLLIRCGQSASAKLAVRAPFGAVALDTPSVNNDFPCRAAPISRYSAVHFLQDIFTTNSCMAYCFWQICGPERVSKQTPYTWQCF